MSQQVTKGNKITLHDVREAGSGRWKKALKGFRKSDGPSWVRAIRRSRWTGPPLLGAVAGSSTTHPDRQTANWGPLALDSRPHAAAGPGADYLSSHPPHGPTRTRPRGPPAEMPRKISPLCQKKSAFFPRKKSKFLNDSRQPRKKKKKKKPKKKKNNANPWRCAFGGSYFDRLLFWPEK